MIGDFLYALTEWLRTTPLVELALWLSNHPASIALQSHFWAIPTVQSLHILSIAAAFGSVLMINMRILGVSGTDRTLAQTSRRFVPWIWAGLAMLILTGLVLVVSEPVRELINPIFWIKMTLVIGVILASLGFQAWAARNIRRWDLSADGSVANGSGAVRAGAVAIILLWCVIIFAGRWIAYAPV